jgi:hypothetical protein
MYPSSVVHVADLQCHPLPPVVWEHHDGATSYFRFDSRLHSPWAAINRTAPSFTGMMEFDRVIVMALLSVCVLVAF